MGRKGKRHKIAPSIYRDQSGIAGIVRVRGQRAELRFPHGTPIPIMRQAMQARRSLLESQMPAAAIRGSLSDLCDRYLATMTGDRLIDRRRLLQPWKDALGTSLFAVLGRSDLQAVADGWRQSGLSASRVNKRISALRLAWRALAPDHAQTHGIEKVTRYSEPHPETRGVPLPLLAELIDAMPDTYVDHKKRTVQNRSKARLRVLLWTGQTPARLAEIKPSHVQWDAVPPLLYVVPRRKGTGSADAWLPLLPHAQDALRALFAAGATGTFNVRSLSLKFDYWRKQAQVLWRSQGRDADADKLDGLRLYDMRHSFAAALAARTADIYATAEYLGHSNLQTTRRYMRSASIARMTEGIGKLARSLKRDA